MEKLIGVAQLQSQFDEILDEVARDHVSYVLARDEQPQAVLVAYDDFLRLLKLDPDREGDLRSLHQFWASVADQNAQYTEKEIIADIEAAREEVAEERARVTGAR